MHPQYEISCLIYIIPEWLIGFKLDAQQRILRFTLRSVLLEERTALDLDAQ
jgi:hypothetical protein